MTITSQYPSQATLTVSKANCQDIADAVNAQFGQGSITHANGRKIKARFSSYPVAHAWGNGSVSVTVEGREARKVGEVWVKVGQTLTIAWNV